MQQHFWLICGLWCGVLGAAYARFRLRNGIRTGEITPEEAGAFTARFALWVLVPCTLLWAIQRSVGETAPPEFFRWPAPQRHWALALQIFVWTAFLFWVFVRDGAVKLSRFLRAATQSNRWMYSPVAVRLGAVVVVLYGVVALTRALSNPVLQQTAFGGH